MQQKAGAVPGATPYNRTHHAEPGQQNPDSFQQCAGQKTEGCQEHSAAGAGIGTFSNPDCFFGRDSVSIGVIVGDGKCILKSYFTTLMLFGLETEILRHGFQLQEVPVFSNEEDEMVEDRAIL